MADAEHSAPPRAGRNSGPVRVFHPAATVKAEGSRRYRTQTARDVACLLDVDHTVVSWRCNATSLSYGIGHHIPDFEVFYSSGDTRFVDAPDRAGSLDEATLEASALAAGSSYRLLPPGEVYDGFRLQNAKDLLRYGNYVATLGDRLRLLAALDEHGSLTMSECLGAFQETRPVPGLASLILRGYVQVDLDGSVLGPETAVRRIRH